MKRAPSVRRDVARGVWRYRDDGARAARQCARAWRTRINILFIKQHLARGARAARHQRAARIARARARGFVTKNGK